MRRAASSAPYYVLWSERGIGSGQDIRGRVVFPSGSLGNNQIVDNFPGDQVLPAREPGATLSRHQVAPAVARVSGGFVYGYQESPSVNSSAHDIFLASVNDQIALGFLEGHVLASTSSPGFDGELSLCSVTGALRCFPVWTRIDSAGDKDVMGALYDHP